MIDKEAALFALSDYLIYSVSGADAERYLHGRITQDVKSLKIGDRAKSLLLSPQGKIQAQFWIIKEEQRYLLVIEPIEAESFVKALLQFKVADDVELNNLSGEFTLYYDAEAARVLIISKDQQKPSNIGSEEQRQIRRILAGQPEFGADLSEKITATDIDISNLVSFDKGCYTGQEVVEMSIARGRPNRRFVKLSSEESLAVEANIYSDKTCEKRVGKITSSCSVAGLSHALGFIKSTVEEDAELYVEGNLCRQG